MNLKIKSSKNINEKASLVTIVSSKTNLPDDFKSLSKDYIKTNFSAQKPLIKNELENINVLALAENKDDFKKLEGLRVNGYLTCKAANNSKIKSIQITGENASEVLAFTEGLILANYQFNKYFSDKKDNSLSEISVVCASVSKKDIEELTNVSEAVYHARTLVNEPQHFLTATQLSEEIKSLSKEAGFTVEVFTKKKIETLKMGGLLAVNKGSVEPPTFNILEYKPKNPSNKKPIVLVGKGVVYDTGGLSLKPTAGSMDFMKSDMGGSAAVIGALYATAKNKLDVWEGVNSEEQVTMNLRSYDEKEQLNDQRNRQSAPYYKLKMVMDYWCSLWFWDMRNAEFLPTRQQYLNDILQKGVAQMMRGQKPQQVYVPFEKIEH